MATDDAKTAKTLTEGDGSALSPEPAEPQTLMDGSGPEPDRDGARVSASNGEELNGDAVVVRRRIVETEVTVEKIFGDEDEADLGCEKENENGLDSALGMDKDGVPLVVNGSEKNGGPENVNGSLDENGGVLEGKSADEITGSMSKLGEMQGNTDDKGQLQEAVDEEDEDGEDFVDMGDENHDYHVGDFVWGKIRSHPWWPGQIYDPSHASAYAAKLKQKDRLLVAYFGDGSFSWCHLSQLRPFVEDFEEMLKQSTSKNFINAVEKALDEISRVVESEMTCSCIPEGDQILVARLVNAGIKAEAHVPEGGTGKLLIAHHGPAELLASVRHIARVNSFNSLLQFAVLKSWLAAFFRARGGYKLCSYCEPRYIVGLEDNKNGEMGRTEFSDPVEVPIQAPLEEDWLEKSSSQKCPEISEDKLYQRRKQKSVADLMREDMDVEPKDKKQSRDKETRSGKSASVNKKSAVNDEVGTKIEDRSVLTSPLGKKRGRKKKAEVSGSPNTAETKVPSSENGGVKGEEANEIPLSRVVNDIGAEPRDKKGSIVEGTKSGKSASGKKKRKVNDETAREDNSVSTSSSGRKRRKEAAFSGSPKAKLSSAEKDDVKAKEEAVKSSAAREKKKSRYLSPPYTDLKRGIRNSSSKKDSETDSERLSNIAQIGERMTRAASQLIGSPSILKCSGKKSQDELPKEVGTGHEASGTKSPKTAKPDQKPNINSMEIDATPCEVLYEVRAAAVNPLCSREEKRLEMITGFFSAFRNSVFMNGSNYKMYNKARSGRKRKSLNSEAGPLEQSEPPKNGSKQKKGNETKEHKPKKVKQAANASSETGPLEQSEPLKNGSKQKKGNEVKEHKPKKVKQAANASSGGTEEPAGGIKGNDKEACRKDSPALLVTFPPGFTLPSKDDIIKIFSKFGALNETETDVFYNSFCARLVFINSSDAEEAFNISLEKNPFGAANVNFRLRYPLAAPRDQKISSLLDKTPENPIPPQQSDNEAPRLGFVKQKLEMITRMVENSGPKISAELKSNLEVEMKGLLEKVSGMMESIST